MKVQVLVLLCIIEIVVSMFSSTNDNREKTCELKKVLGMVGYVCSNLGLREIPVHLNPDLGVSILF